jgi:hypothetical protein
LASDAPETSSAPISAGLQLASHLPPLSSLPEASVVATTAEDGKLADGERVRQHRRAMRPSRIRLSIGPGSVNRRTTNRPTRRDLFNLLADCALHDTY